MQRLKVSGAVTHIWVVRRQTVNNAIFTCFFWGGASKGISTRFFSLKRPHRLWDPASLLPNGYRYVIFMQ